MKLSGQEINSIESKLSEIEHLITEKIDKLAIDSIQFKYISKTIQTEFLKEAQKIRTVMQHEDASLLGIMKRAKEWERRVKYVLGKVEFVGELRIFVTLRGLLRVFTSDLQRFISENELNVIHTREDGTIVNYKEPSTSIEENLVASGIVGKKIYGPALVQSQVLGKEEAQGETVRQGTAVFNRTDTTRDIE